MKIRFAIRQLVIGTVLWLAPAAAHAAACGANGQPFCLASLGTNLGCDPWTLNIVGICRTCGDTSGLACIVPAGCRPWNNNVLGVCVACGGEAQEACKSGSACRPGLTKLHNSIGVSVDACFDRGKSEEPDTGLWTAGNLVLKQPANQPVKGIADLHTHQFADLGFGGAMFHGASYDPKGINSALDWCDFTNRYATRFPGSGAPLTPAVPFLGSPTHGPGGAFDLLGLTLTGASHDVSGTGSFEGWPNWDTVTHQQMYHTWLKRAYEGGLRLMVVHAVSNEALCDASIRRDGWSCKDMAAVDRQLDAAKALEAAIDKGAGGAGKGWYRIAYTPKEARQVIAAGKLAVVLGIEVDDLLGCSSGPCSEQDVRTRLRTYHNKGVRHLFPVHVFDNAFGGAALYVNTFNAGNALVGQGYFETRDCQAEGNGFTLLPDQLVQAIEHVGVLGPYVAGVVEGLLPPVTHHGADCNARGLTNLGRVLIDEMINLGMIIDTDHMSSLTRQEVIQIAIARGYPLVSGHSGFSALVDEQERSEYGMTDADLDAFKQLGGLVTVSVPRGPETTADYPARYKHVLERMGGAGPYNDAAHPLIAFSTDFNGLVKQAAPRCASTPCLGDSSKPPLDYESSEQTITLVVTPGFWLPIPFAPSIWVPPVTLQIPVRGLEGPLGGLFAKQVTGSRTFDLNHDGFAHIGMLPDFFGDLLNLGMTKAELQPMTNSAETYIRLWERADSAGPAKPLIVADVTGSLGAGDWYNSDVQLAWEITSSVPHTASGCDPASVTADTDAAGVTFTCSASNEGGTSSVSVVIKRDTTPPTLTFDHVSPPPNAAGWHNADVLATWRCSDALSGVVSEEAPAGDGSTAILLGLTSEGEGQSLTATCRDNAGNVAADTRDAIHIDKTPPTIAFSAPPSGWSNADVVFDVVAADVLSGVDQPTLAPNPLVVTAEGDNVTGTVTVTDRAGNAATALSPAVMIDKTPPLLLPALAEPSPNAAGWNNGDVTLSWSCVDPLSGVASSAPEASDAGASPQSVRQIRAILTSEGALQVRTATCADYAGNVATAQSGAISVDKTPPTLAFGAQEPPANADGWNRSEVSWPFSGQDTLSGVDASSQTSAVVGGEGVALSTRVTIVDIAGNSAFFDTPPVKIDRSGPSIALLTRLPAPDAGDWNNTDVTATWSCSDGLSGAVSETVSATLASEGAGQTLFATCSDVAGNVASDTLSGLNIDKTPPVLSLPPDQTLDPTSPAGAPFDYAARAEDALAGAVAPSCSPGSASTFPMGTTVVTCTAGDGHGNGASGSFSVHVKTEEELLEELDALVELRRFDNELRHLERSLDRDKDKQACKILASFIKQVSRVKAKKLAAALQLEILGRAHALEAALGCPVPIHERICEKDHQHHGRCR